MESIQFGCFPCGPLFSISSLLAIMWFFCRYLIVIRSYAWNYLNSVYTHTPINKEIVFSMNHRLRKTEILHVHIANTLFAVLSVSLSLSVYFTHSIQINWFDVVRTELSLKADIPLNGSIHTVDNAVHNERSENRMIRIDVIDFRTMFI